MNVEAVSSMFHNGRRPDSAASINSATPLTANPDTTYYTIQLYYDIACYNATYDELKFI